MERFDPMSWIIRILVLSLIVGLVISFFDINPMGILNDTWDTVLAVLGFLQGSWTGRCPTSWWGPSSSFPWL